MVDDVQKCGFNQLCLNDGSLYAHQRLMRKHNRPFGNGINFACKAECPQIVDKISRKQVQPFQIGNVLLGKTKSIDVFNGLLKPGGNRVAVSAGIFAIEQVENDLLAVRACFIVALHHGQLI